MLPGQAFHGHVVAAYDPAKKKYVGSWTDSMSKGLGTSESTWDAATRTMSGYMAGADETGKAVKMRTVVEYKDGRRIFTVYGPGPDGKEIQSMRITYTRKQ
jgi:hypothetical protein